MKFSSSKVWVTNSVTVMSLMLVASVSAQHAVAKDHEAPRNLHGKVLLDGQILDVFVTDKGIILGLQNFLISDTTEGDITGSLTGDSRNNVTVQVLLNPDSVAAVKEDPSELPITNTDEFKCSNQDNAVVIRTDNQTNGAAGNCTYLLPVGN